MFLMPSPYHQYWHRHTHTETKHDVHLHYIFCRLSRLTDTSHSPHSPSLTSKWQSLPRKVPTCILGAVRGLMSCSRTPQSVGLKPAAVVNWRLLNHLCPLLVTSYYYRLIYVFTFTVFLPIDWKVHISLRLLPSLMPLTACLWSR